MKPVVVLVGRPNVGKSTLFNRLTRSRAALVADEPGLTRDRQYGDGRVGDRPYYVVDTGGLVEGLQTGAGRRDIYEQMAAQTRQAVAEADSIVFLVSARDGLTAVDRQIGADLRRTGKPLWLAVNKAEGMVAELVAAEFHALGLGAPQPLSAAHGEGVAALMERALAGLPRVAEPEGEQDVPRIAVIGRPNAGKSTLVNALLGETRMLVADEAGTTRDSISVPLEFRGRHYVLVDTAGVRRRARVTAPTEKFSALKTLQAVDEANVVVAVVDAAAGVGEQDVALASYALEHGRSLVLAVNKWDLLEAAQRDWVKRELERKCRFLDYVKVHFLSALQGAGVHALFGSIDAAFASANRTLPTPKLNRVLQAAVQATPPPLLRGRRARPKYAHQAGKNPPTIVIHGNQVAALSPSYRRYLAGRFRAAFHLSGTPVRLEFRQGENPYAREPRRRRGSRTS
jgi:GTP-binding protein